MDGDGPLTERRKRFSFDPSPPVRIESSTSLISLADDERDLGEHSDGVSSLQDMRYDVLVAF